MKKTEAPRITVHGKLDQRRTWEALAAPLAEQLSKGARRVEVTPFNFTCDAKPGAQASA